MATIASTFTPAQAKIIERQPESPIRMAWRRLRRHRMAMFGLVLLLGLLLYVTAGTFIFSEEDANFNNVSIKLQGPSAAHPFGTDAIGRDILARTIYGGQISILVALLAVIISLVVGVLVGAFAGYYGGIVDSSLMRFTEAMLNIPQLLLLIFCAKFLSDRIDNFEFAGREFSGSLVVIIVIIGLTSWMYLARIVRSSFLSLKNNEYVAAARSLGVKNGRIIFRHILPNAIAPIIVAATLGIANAILLEAYVSFLGLGVRQPTATWGNMLEDANRYLATAPQIWIFPGLLILVTVLSINFIGDGLRDALDPRSLAE